MAGSVRAFLRGEGAEGRRAATAGRGEVFAAHRPDHQGLVSPFLPPPSLPHQRLVSTGLGNTLGLDNMLMNKYISRR